MSQISLIPESAPCPFVFKDHHIRTITDESQLWFAAKDVCSALGIGWNGTTLANIPDKWQGMRKFRTPSGFQNLRAIQEPGVYKLAFRSNKDEADEFTNWIASEVVPSIRKTGQYSVAPALEATLTPSTADDRKPLRSLVFAWSNAAGVHVDTCWPQVKAHFQITRLGDLPVEWIPDALAFVQGKIDAIPKALPEPPKIETLGSRVTNNLERAKDSAELITLYYDIQRNVKEIQKAATRSHEIVLQNLKDLPDAGVRRNIANDIRHSGDAMIAAIVSQIEGYNGYYRAAMLTNLL